MDLDFSWINLLILFGALQGLIFGIILLTNKKHPGAGFLSVFMFALAYNGLETFNWSSKLGLYIFFFDLFPFVMIYTLGPSLYLYIQSLLDPERPLSMKEVLVWYAPPLFQFTFRMVIISLYLLIIYDILPNNGLLDGLDGLYYSYAELLSVVTFFVYLYLSFRLYRNAGAHRPVSYISREAGKGIHKWIRALLLCMMVMAIAWPLTLLAPVVFELKYDSYYYPIELALVVFIYWIAFVGYWRTKMIFLKASGSSSSSISASRAEKLMAQLRHAMENDRLYLDPALNRSRLAEHTGIHTKTISAILNQYSQQTFNDFVNDYRVREVRKKLNSRESQHLTISGIALESGFNSQATFQRAFKNNTGMSPREYLSRQSG